MSSVGKIIWTDLTVPNADEVRDFYSAVAGWTPQNVEMGENRLCVIRDPAGAVAALFE